MSKLEVLEALQHLTSAEKLEIIEVATRLLQQAPPASAASTLRRATEIMRPFYEQGSELVQWTDEDPEELYDYQSRHLSNSISFTTTINSSSGTH